MFINFDFPINNSPLIYAQSAINDDNILQTEIFTNSVPTSWTQETSHQSQSVHPVDNVQHYYAEGAVSHTFKLYGEETFLKILVT